MHNIYRFISLITLLILIAGCNQGAESIESISIDYPHGETRLLVLANGEAFLYYGALPQKEVVQPGIFDVATLYEQVQPRLHATVPREDWPNPSATAGMVQISFDNGKERSYLIFDEQDFADALFDKARQNIIGETP